MKESKLFESIVSLLLVPAFVLLILSGCEGGGGGGGGNPTPTVLQGVFVDSPVANLDYVTESQAGQTNSQGVFHYVNGEMISFYIGDILLGQGLAKDEMGPRDLVAGALGMDDPTVVNICSFLQTLDDDGNPENGIVIPAVVVEAIAGGSINFLQSTDEFSNDPAVKDLIADLTILTEAGQRNLVSAERALEHYMCAMGQCPDPDENDNDNDGYTQNQGDCDDTDPAVHPGATEVCGDTIDNDCAGGDAVCPTSCTDNDGDNYAVEGFDCGPVDCNDTDPAINPGAAEICGDTIDNDCMGGDAVGDSCNHVDADNNLASTGIEVLDTDTLQVGHPIRLKVGIGADKDTDDVSVQFLILDKEEYDKNGDDGARSVIGASLFEKVSAGDNTYTAEIFIPFTDPFTSADINGEPVINWSAIKPGTYYLYAEVDPADMIPEIDEYDNSPMGPAFPYGAIAVEVSDANKDVPSIVVEEFLIEIPVIELPGQPVDAGGDGVDPYGNPIKNVPNSDFDVNAIVRASGSYWINDRPGPIPRVDIQATIQHPGISDITVQIWDSSTSNYSDTLSVSEVQPGVPTSVHLDLRLPAENADLLQLASYLVERAETCLLSCPSTDIDLDCVTQKIDLLDSCPDWITYTINDVEEILACSGIPEIEHTNKISECGFDVSCYLDNGYVERECFVSQCINNNDQTTCNVDGVRVVQCLGLDEISQCVADECYSDCGDQLLLDGLGLLHVEVSAYDAAGNIIEEFDVPGYEVSNDLYFEIVMLRPSEVASPPGNLMIGAISESEADAFGDEPIHFSTSYQTGFYSKFFSIGVKAAASAQLDASGAGAILAGSLPINIFGKAFDFMSVSMNSGAFPDPDDVLETNINPLNYFTSDLGFLSQTIFTEEITLKGLACLISNIDEMTTYELGGIECALDCEKNEPPVDVPKTDSRYKAKKAERDRKVAECMLKECGAIGKSMVEEKDLWLGPVPLTISFKAHGLIGIAAKAKLWNPCPPPPGDDTDPDDPEPLFMAYAGPYADLGTDVSAGVGNKLFSGGVGGNLTLIRDQFYGRVEVPLLEIDDSNITGSLYMDITNTLTGPNGELYTYVAYPCTRWCKKWGVPYPCGWQTCKLTQSFAKFSSFEKKDVLFLKELSTSIPLPQIPETP